MKRTGTTLAAAAAGMAREWSSVLAALVGAAVRLDQIGIQIPLDDEWHALHAIERFGYGHVLTHFGWTDYCIPLTFFYKLVSDTFGLSELWLRLPVVSAGILSIVVMPLTLRPWVGREASRIFAWLLAVSPLHVYFSRYARPYSIALLLAFVAAFALLHVRFLGRRRWTLAYVAAMVLSPYFHLTTLPIVALPLAIAWAEDLLRRNGAGQSLAKRTLWIVSGGAGLGLLALLGPPLAIDHQALFYKAGRGTPDAATLHGAAQLIGGSARPEALIGLAVLALAGAIALARRRAIFAAYLAVVSALALSVPLLTHPVLSEAPIVFVRYALILLPLGLVLVACGSATAAGLAGVRAPLVAALLGPGLAALLFALGPLPETHRHPNAWTNHPAFQYSYSAPRCSPTHVVPPFYHWLARRPAGSSRVLEAPWLFAAVENAFPCYQRVHRQHMLVGFVGGVFDAQGVKGLPRPGELPVLSKPDNYRLRSFIHLDADAEMRRRGVQLLILHKALATEMGGAAATTPGLGIEPWIQRYRERFGAPAYEDRAMVVFDIDQPRDAQAPPPSAR